MRGEVGMCEAQRTTGAAGVVVGCEPLKRNYNKAAAVEKN